MAVIPARFAATRFPGKPLVPILGVPMVVHVAARAREADCFHQVAVATDDERIAGAARAAGVSVIMTGDARNGTERVAQAAAVLEADVVVNVQGDEPALPPENLAIVTRYLMAHPECPMATLALPADERDLADPNVVKVVCGADGRALYFSRAAIPYPRAAIPGLARRHVGVYGYQRSALLQLVAWPECELERAEGLEQLRALHHGMGIQVLEAAGDSVAVDIPEDIPRAEEALRRLKGGGEWQPSTSS